MAEKNPVVLLADEQSFVQLCGISLLERSLRILQRLGFTHVNILALEPALINRHLAAPSWARSEITFEVLDHLSQPFAKDTMTLLLRGDFYHDSRLLQALCAQQTATLLMDSSPPLSLQPLLARECRTSVGYACGAAIVPTRALTLRAPASEVFPRFAEAVQRGEMQFMDVSELPTYLVNLRRHLRPLWFPAPAPSDRRLAENFLLDAAQNGTLDLPAKVHAPIETWIIARLCRTSITPNQITLFTATISAGVTAFFATGHLLAGTLLALAVGVLDGLDGKQARVKVETTPLGKREHALDYVLELSWWSALAFHFASSGAVPNALLLLALLVGSDLIDRFAKKLAKEKTGRNLDDLAPIDRFVRLLGGRRNIYVWMLAAGLMLGAPDQAFRWLCYWGAGTAAVHLLRVVWLRRSHRLPE